MSVLLATPATSTRINFEDVICILKHGLDRNIVELVQEMVRARRFKNREHGDYDSFSVFINVERFCSMFLQISISAVDECAR